jgi:hypothetical protein
MALPQDLMLFRLSERLPAQVSQDPSIDSMQAAWFFELY